MRSEALEPGTAPPAGGPAGGPGHSVGRRAPGRRTRLILACTAAAAVAYWALGLSLGELVPRPAGRAVLGELLGAAVRPALTREVPIDGAPALLLDVLGAAWRTLAFAVAGMGCALILAVPLLLLSTDALWARALECGGVLAGGARLVRSGARLASALLRSVHELLWAVLLLSALGVEPFTGVVALALPFAGTLARLGSEMIDESDPAPALALRHMGAGSAAELFLGRLPLSLGDQSAYAFYRFECALRSAAVLGFFGYDTLGLRLKGSFDHLRYGEFWTYLYALLAMVLVFEALSARLRRRFVV